MGLTIGQVIVILLPVVVGALIGLVPATILEHRRTRAALHTRWDTVLHTTSAQFAAAVRRILDLAKEADRADGEESRATLLAELRREHSRLQVLMAEVRLLAGVASQSAARAAVGHTWSLYLQLTTGSDPKAGESDQTPRQRTVASLFDFYRATRRQLRVPDADDLAPMNQPSI